MTADELLHKYFDVLAVEQLQPETCALLSEFRVKTFSENERENFNSIQALAQMETTEFEKLIVLWTNFFFEAQITQQYEAIQGEFLIQYLLTWLYVHLAGSRLPSDETLVAMLSFPEPNFYASNKVFNDFLAVLKSAITRKPFNKYLLLKIIDFNARYSGALNVIALKNVSGKSTFLELHYSLQMIVRQYTAIKKYVDNIGVHPEIYLKLKSINSGLATMEELLSVNDEQFQQLTLTWTSVFFEAYACGERNTIVFGDIFVSSNTAHELLKLLYGSKVLESENFLLALLDVVQPVYYYKNSATKYLLGLFERFKRKNKFSPTLLAKITDFYNKYQALKVREEHEKEYAQLQSRIKDVITPYDEVPTALPFDNKIGQTIHYRLTTSELHSAAWPAQIATDIAGLSSSQQQAWHILWAHAAIADGATPKAIWIKKAKQLISMVDDFSQMAAQWLVYVLEDVRRNDIELTTPFSEINKQAIKGFIWLCSAADTPILASPLADIVNFGYSKAYGIGARAPAVANAALYTLGLIGAQGVVQLSKLRSKVKFKAGLKLIEKSLAEAAARQGISQDDLEELSVPLFGLNAYAKQATFGQYHVIAHLQGSKSIQEQWSNSHDGSVLKKMPPSVKQDYRSEFKDWQKEITDIQDVLVGQIKRLEDSYLRKRQWRFSDWQARFIQHPLLSWLGKRLIWRFEHQSQIQHGLFLADSLVNAQQQPLAAIADDAVVTLWHPILSTVEEVQQWRTLLTAQQLVQPIKQAYREVYFITPAEIETGDYSNRFARHVLKQHHFAALCKERGWDYRLQGDFDGFNSPHKSLNAWQLEVSFGLDMNDNQSVLTQTGLYQYITTAAVRFSHAGKSCALVDVPPIVFSEMMRDIDLFVGVTSVGTDTTTDMYANNAHADYIDAFSKAELSARAIVRKEVLSNIISKLAIAPRCSFDNKHLIVKGDLRIYKIHLGSSNILMEPNDQYLCIVPSSKQKEASTDGLYLPFEGDHTLSVVLSKALLLAADKKIKDAGIVSQIKRV